MIPTEARDTEYARPRSRARAWAIEGLIAIILVLAIMGPLFLYSGGWPPVYAVQSESMEHGAQQAGPLDVGDLFVVRRLATTAEIITYAQGRAIGHATFGEYGDVILFRNTVDNYPVIHRAILRLVFDPGTGTWNAPDLQGLTQGKDWIRSDGGTGIARIHRNAVITLIQVMTVAGDLRIELSRLDGSTGIITKGDNADTNPQIDQHSSNIAPRTPIPDERIVGIARGELPCVGVLPLAITGAANRVTGDDSTCAAVVIVVIIVIAYVAHYTIAYLWRRRKARRGEPARSGPKGSPAHSPRPAPATPPAHAQPPFQFPAPIQAVPYTPATDSSEARRRAAVRAAAVARARVKAGYVQPTRRRSGP